MDEWLGGGVDRRGVGVYVQFRMNHRRECGLLNGHKLSVKENIQLTV